MNPQPTTTPNIDILEHTQSWLFYYFLLMHFIIIPDFERCIESVAQEAAVPRSGLG